MAGAVLGVAGEVASRRTSCQTSQVSRSDGLDLSFNDGGVPEGDNMELFGFGFEGGG